MAVEKRTCPQCGEKLEPTAKGAYRYGSPLRACKKCGRQYLDRTYHEIAIDGIRKEDLSAKENIKMFLICLAASVVLIGANILSYAMGRIYFAMAAICVIMILGTFAFLGDFLKVVTGRKKKELEKERQASIARLQNKEYAHTLKGLGYQVPEEFL